MQDHGHPDASVQLAASPKGGAGPEGAATRVDVLVGVQSRGTVSVERVWFEGNRVTRESVMRQLLTVREGDLFRQNEIDTSVQNLLRIQKITLPTPRHNIDWPALNALRKKHDSVADLVRWLSDCLAKRQPEWVGGVVR